MAPGTKKVREEGLTWYGHVKRKDEGHVLRRMSDVPVQLYQERDGSRGRQKTGWKDSCKRDMEVWG